MSGFVLALDASTYAGSVAILAGDRVVAEGDAVMRGAREERLMPAVADVLGRAGVALAGLTGIVCGAGPGSFTSLRIAASIAKGLAVSLGIPLAATSSLALIVSGSARPLPAGRYLAALDAIRGEVFAQTFTVDDDGRVVAAGPSSLVASAQLAERGVREGARVIGPATSPSATPHARGVARLLSSPLLVTVDVASWEPDYGRLAEAQVQWEQRHGRSLVSEA